MKFSGIITFAGLLIVLLAMGYLTYQAKRQATEVSAINIALKDSIRLLRNAEEAKNTLLDHYVPKADSQIAATAIAVNQDNFRSIPTDLVGDVNLKNVYAIEKSLTNMKTYWVYVGQGNGSNWRSKNFKIHGPLSANTDITAITAVYKRDADPQPFPDVDWKLGKIIGVVDSGQKVHIISAKSITGANWWAEVSE